MKTSPLLAALLLTLTACDRKSADTESPPMEAAEAPTNRIDIPPTVRRNLGITFAKVERRQVADTLRVPGAFELKPLAKHEYRISLPGHVRFETDQFAEVQVGTLLFRFQSPQWLELQSRIDRAVAAYNQAQLKNDALTTRLEALTRADFKRADLESEATGLQGELSGLKAELDAALATAVNLLNAHGGPKGKALTADDLLAPVEINDHQFPRYRSIDWIEARAIEPGIVESLAITDGGFAEETTLVLTTIDPTQVRFRALALQSDLTKLSQAPTATIVPHQSGGGDINDVVPAALTLGLDADPAQRTIPLYANPLEERPWARPGVSAFLEVVTATTGGPVLAIPRSAVVKDGIVHVFFKRDPLDLNKAIRIEADLGIDDGRWIEIKSDLGPNDEVVLEGAFELKLATSQSGTNQKGGHFHADGTYHEEH
jgi:hypothetical protein